MSDEETTLDTEDSVDETTTDTSTEDVDWQKRYTDTQAEYTRQQQALKDLQSKIDDEDSLIDVIREKHPHLLADDEDDTDLEDTTVDEETPQFLTREEFTKWQSERAAEESTKQFMADLERFRGDRELSQQGRNSIMYAAQQGEIKSPDDLKKAVDGWFEYLDEQSQAGIKPKRAPHVVAAGKANTGVKDFSEMSQDEINEYMAERARALMS